MPATAVALAKEKQKIAELDIITDPEEAAPAASSAEPAAGNPQTSAASETESRKKFTKSYGA